MAAALLAASCSSALHRMIPAEGEPENNEVNLVFVLENNLVILPSLTVDGHPGRFLFGSAAPQTILDPRTRPAGGSHELRLNQRETLRFTAAAVDLHGVADGIIGADLWHNHTVSIDYYAGLVTYQKEGMHQEDMTVFPFSAEPAVQLSVDGATIAAIVDTTSPDTLTLPRAARPAARAKARVTLAGTDFGEIDVNYADVSAARIGNRLLSRFLVSIDYGGKRVGLWRDPRSGHDPLR